MQCSLCNSSSASYKCPTCTVPYCSVKCWRVHRDQKCRKYEPEKTEIVSTLDCYSFQTIDTVPIEALNSLERSEGLRSTLYNPHVRSILNAINNSTNPTNALKQAMLEPIFVQFVEECLKVIEPSKEESSSI